VCEQATSNVFFLKFKCLAIRGDELRGQVKREKREGSTSTYLPTSKEQTYYITFPHLDT